MFRATKKIFSQQFTTSESVFFKKLRLKFKGEFQPIRLRKPVSTIDVADLFKNNQFTLNNKFHLIKNYLITILEGNPKIFYTHGNSNISDWARIKHQISSAKNFHQLSKSLTNSNNAFSNFLPTYAQTVATTLQTKNFNENLLLKAIAEDFPEFFKEQPSASNKK